MIKKRPEQPGRFGRLRAPDGEQDANSVAIWRSASFEALRAQGYAAIESSEWANFDSNGPSGTNISLPDHVGRDAESHISDLVRKKAKLERR
jgi:hypothetical protein